MWPFKKKKSEADEAVAVLPQTIEIVAGKWVYFCKSLPFKEDVPLIERITAFSVPMFEGIRKNVPALRKAPDALLLIIVAKGVEKSGTHTREQIEEALGAPLPE